MNTHDTEERHGFFKLSRILQICNAPSSGDFVMSDDPSLAYDPDANQRFIFGYPVVVSPIHIEGAEFILTDRICGTFTADIRPHAIPDGITI